jgi:hypothetical protein
MGRAGLLLAFAASLLAPNAAHAQQDAAFRAFLQNELGEDRDNYPDTRYVLAWADLDDDGRGEAIVYLMSDNVCGTGGCTLLVYTPAGTTWRKVGDVPITNAPIRLLDTRTRGWRDIGVRVAGGGIRAFDALLPFGGTAYPDNPSGPPARRLRGAVPGRVLISDGDQGQRLF